MHQMIKHTGFQLALLYLLLMGMYNQGGMTYAPDNGLAVDAQVTAASFEPAFENPFYGIQPEWMLTEVTAQSPTQVNPAQKDYSIHSRWANLAASWQIADYIFCSSLIVVQPHIFDMLFPFHYYS